MASARPSPCSGKTWSAPRPGSGPSLPTSAKRMSPCTGSSAAAGAYRTTAGGSPSRHAIEDSGSDTADAITDLGGRLAVVDDTLSAVASEIAGAAEVLTVAGRWRGAWRYLRGQLGPPAGAGRAYW